MQTSLSPELLHKRLHAIHRDAKTAEEERGINILYLALGFLRWYEDDRSDVPREAPLILLPVSLVRDAKRSAFDVKLREDDIATNQALQERLRGDFGIALPNIPETDDWLPSDYFDATITAVAANRRWSIDANAIELGFYSFSKLLMVRDLEPSNWPDNILASHPLLRGLLCEGFAAEPPLLPETAKLDDIFGADRPRPCRRCRFFANARHRNSPRRTQSRRSRAARDRQIANDHQYHRGRRA